VKAIAAHLMNWSKGVGDVKGTGITVIIICHVTKDGDISGPRFLEHAVDAIYNFTSPSKRSKMRSLVCEGKNRFGDATGELVLEMTGKGLIERGRDGDNYDDYEDN
jgi:DNA repair protein RadA/Sms